MSVYGAYASESTPPGGIEITHGDSKDHRPDLKQFIVEMMCGNDGEVPLAIEIASGNQSDKAVFGQRLKAFAQQWDVDGIRVADSALYSEGNLSELGALRWITRVPLTLSEAQALVTELPPETLEASEREGYRLARVQRTYAGIPQQWVGVENQARVESDRQQVDKQVDKCRQQAEKARLKPTLAVPKTPSPKPKSWPQRGAITPSTRFRSLNIGTMPTPGVPRKERPQPRLLIASPPKSLPTRRRLNTPNARPVGLSWPPMGWMIPKSRRRVF